MRLHEALQASSVFTARKVFYSGGAFGGTLYLEVQISIDGFRAERIVEENGVLVREADSQEVNGFINGYTDWFPINHFPQ